MFVIFKCVGRAIRGKTDYGVMVFADKVCVLLLFFFLDEEIFCIRKRLLLSWLLKLRSVLIQS